MPHAANTETIVVKGKPGQPSSNNQVHLHWRVVVVVS